MFRVSIILQLYHIIRTTFMLFGSSDVSSIPCTNLVQLSGNRCVLDSYEVHSIVQSLDRHARQDIKLFVSKQEGGVGPICRGRQALKTLKTPLLFF